MSLAYTRPVFSSTTTPQTCVVFESTPRCDGLTGFVVAGGTKCATSFGAFGLERSITRTPSVYHDVYEVVPTMKLLWMTKSPAAISPVPAEFGVLYTPICFGADGLE